MMTVDEAIARAGHLIDAHMQSVIAAMREDLELDDDAEAMLRRRFGIWRAAALARLEVQLRDGGNGRVAVPDYTALLTAADDASMSLH